MLEVKFTNSFNFGDSYPEKKSPYLFRKKEKNEGANWSSERGLRGESTYLESGELEFDLFNDEFREF